MREAFKEARHGFSRMGSSGELPDGFPSNLEKQATSLAPTSRPSSFCPLGVISIPAINAKNPLIPAHPPWEEDHDDPENDFLSHRFGWSLMALASGISNDELVQILEMADLWRKTHPCQEEGTGWDTYSVAERAVHWLFLISAAQKRGIQQSDLFGGLEESLDEHSSFLVRHLELRGASTNNHLINDARALYLIGVCRSNEELRRFAAEVLNFGAKTMFGPSGFLREGSSHYHVLLTRTFLEVLWASRVVNDRETWDSLRDKVVAMVQATAFLQGNGKLPFIGDISPDFPPEFHEGVCAVGAELLEIDYSARLVKKGWHSLFIQGTEIDRPPRRVSHKYKKESYVDAGFYRFLCSDWELFLYSNPLGYVPSWSHGHADILGFELYFQDTPFLVDTGRSTYLDDEIGQYERSAKSHNGVLIDGLEACLVHNHSGYTPAMLSEYYDRPLEFFEEEIEDGFRIEIFCRGFERVQSGLTVRRRLEFSDKHFSIADEITGSGQRLIETYFHFHPDVVVSPLDDGSFQSVLPNKMPLVFSTEGDGPSSFDLCRGVDFPEPAGWFSPRYGERFPSDTLVWRGYYNLPLRRRYVIRREQ